MKEDDDFQNFHKFLKEQADPLFGDKGHKDVDGYEFHWLARCHWFFGDAAEAMVLDGVNRETLMRMFIIQAIEVMFAGSNESDSTDKVLQFVQKRRRELDELDAEQHAVAQAGFP